MQTTAFVAQNEARPNHRAIYLRLTDGRNEKDKSDKFLSALANPVGGLFFRANADNFDKIPGSPIAYWLSESGVRAFQDYPSLKNVLRPKQGTSTGDDEKFVRFWHEVNHQTIGLGFETLDAARKSKLRYFPLDKGGSFRKWYGNNEKILRFDEPNYNELMNMGNHLPSRDLYFKRGLTWSKITSFQISVRFDDFGFIFSSVGLKGFPKDDDCHVVLGYMNSRLALMFTEVLSPTLSIISGDIEKLPFRSPGSLEHDEIDSRVRMLVQIAKTDWDNFETSWDFRDFPLLRGATLEVESGKQEAKTEGSGKLEVESGKQEAKIVGSGKLEVGSEKQEAKTAGTFHSPLSTFHSPLPTSHSLKGLTLAESWANWNRYCSSSIRRMQELETENNRLFIAAYGLDGELQPEVPEAQITLARADVRKDMAAFLSYAVGCMMGRYSLDAPGLILANAGDTLEAYAEKISLLNNSTFKIQNSTFHPDTDGIIPVLDGEWFEDDIVARTREFLRATFGEATLKENLRFIEDSLGKDLRKYFLTDFYKDHLQTYKKRPIYWLVQSPKKGFSVLVYLHRYTRDTFNLVLNSYLRDYQVMLRNRLSHLAQAQVSAASARDKTEARKESDKLTKTLHECEEWERQTLLPLAQARIELDLDDGVKVNYLKLGEALAPIAGLAAKEED